MNAKGTIWNKADAKETNSFINKKGSKQQKMMTKYPRERAKGSIETTGFMRNKDGVFYIKSQVVRFTGVEPSLNSALFRKVCPSLL